MLIPRELLTQSEVIRDLVAQAILDLREHIANEGKCTDAEKWEMDSRLWRYIEELRYLADMLSYPQDSVPKPKEKLPV